MEIVIFNASLYLITLLIYWRKRRKIDIGVILLSLYTLVAIVCVFNYALGGDIWELRLWPFLYLYIVVMLFFRPYFFDNDTLFEKLKVRNRQVLRIMFVLYIFFALVAIYYSLDEAIYNLRTTQWAFIRNELYKGQVELYSNQVERAAKIFVDYLRPLFIILFFYYLTKKDANTLWLVVSAIAIIIPVTLAAIIVVSRGMFVTLALDLFAGYLIFRKGISKAIKKKLGIIFLIFLILALSFSINVTISRFGESQKWLSILDYFGHSMLTFNYGIADSIIRFGNGKYFFDWFLPFLNIEPIDFDLLGSHFGTRFFTFVGAWYIDFGPVATFLIALILPSLMAGIFRYKKRVDIADLFIFLFYLDYLLGGVFVVGKGYALPWSITFLVYLIIKGLK
jgi:oligosaccharide repeat unit polymerase